ncbi:hypothetical protein [Blastomonas sp. CCH8-A3]|uniref:hypothetical protein n=1 Tax=Blastomonas sp. CCH8-A3 TaxID=1768743 RepID=UPI001E53CF9E|nr:hypothetical protein [Blastomonas sp. CCH8-A3]
MHRILAPQPLEEGSDLVALEQAWAGHVDFRKRDSGNCADEFFTIQTGLHC